MPRQENKVRWEGQKKMKTEKMCVKKEAKSVEPFKIDRYLLSFNTHWMNLTMERNNTVILGQPHPNNFVGVGYIGEK